MCKYCNGRGHFRVISPTKWQELHSTPEYVNGDRATQTELREKASTLELCGDLKVKLMKKQLKLQNKKLLGGTTDSGEPEQAKGLELREEDSGQTNSAISGTSTVQT